MSRPLLACPILLTALAALGVIVLGAVAIAVNPRTFGVGIGGILICYGALLVAVAWLAATGRRWAMGLIVASSLLHLLVLGSFISALPGDWVPFGVSVAVASLVLVTLVSALVVVGRGEMG